MFFLFSFSANILYGSAQSLPLPHSKFAWMSDESIQELEFLLQTSAMPISENQSTGYILEVDLEYPEHLHVSHNSFPLAPERMEVTPEMMSDYAKGAN
jgi:hypothetical protein